MQVAVRSCLTAGVSLIGAGALLVSPISPSAPVDIQVPAIHSAMVDLAASTNPIQQWADVIEGVVTNVVGIGSAVASDPAPILRALLTNQLGYAQEVATSLEALGDSLGAWAADTVAPQMQTIVTALSEGNFVGVANAVNTMIGGLVFAAVPAAAVLTIPVKMAESLVRVVTAATDLFTVMFPLAVGALGPIMGTIEATGDQGQALVNAISAGDPLAALGAIINTPGVLVGGFLNGYTAAYPDEWGYHTFYPGLLTWDPVAGNGIVGSLLVTIPKMIANALAGPASFALKTTTPTAPDGVASVPDLDAKTVSVDAPADTLVGAPKTVPDSVSAETAGPVETAPEESAEGEESSAPEESAAAEESEAGAAEETVDDDTDLGVDGTDLSDDGDDTGSGTVGTGTDSTTTPSDDEVDTAPTKPATGAGNSTGDTGSGDSGDTGSDGSGNE